MADLNDMLRKRKAARATSSMTDGEASEVSAPERDERGVLDFLSGTGLEATLLGAAQGLTFGFGDELRAAVRSPFTDKTYGQELESARSMMGRAAQEHGNYMMGGELAGAMLPALFTGGATAAASMPAAIAKGAATGAASSGLAGFGGAEGGFGERIEEAGKGALAGGILGGVFGAGSRFVGQHGARMKQHAGRTTTAALREAKDAAYKAVGDSGIVLEPQNMVQMVDDMKARVSSNEFFDPRLSKEDAEIMGMINKIAGKVTMPASKSRKVGPRVAQMTQHYPPEKTFTVAQLDKLRRDAWERYNKTDNPAILDIINSIDDAVDRSGGGPLMDAAREANKVYKKSELLDHLVEKAQLETKSTHAGTNINNKYRQAFTKVITNPKLARSFSPDEIKAMTELTEGSKLENFLRWHGRLSPERGGLMAAVNAAAIMHNPALAGLAASGFTSKRLSDRMTQDLVEQFRSDVVGFKPPPPTTRQSAFTRALTQEHAGDILSAATGLGRVATGSTTEAPNPELSPSIMDEMMRWRLEQGG